MTPTCIGLYRFVNKLINAFTHLNKIQKVPFTDFFTLNYCLVLLFKVIVAVLVTGVSRNVVIAVVVVGVFVIALALATLLYICSVKRKAEKQTKIKGKQTIVKLAPTSGYHQP